MQPSTNHVLMYFQLYLQLKNDILLQELPPGTRLPTINDLSKLYKLSDGTVRRALALLENEGLISKKRGAGTFVRTDTDLSMWTPSSSIKEIQETLQPLTIQPLSEGWIVPPRRIKAIFSDQQDAFRDGRIFKQKHLSINNKDNRRKNLSDLYIPAWIIDEFSPDQLRNMSGFEILFRLEGLNKIKINQTIRPWLCDKESAVLLQLPDGTPIFHRSWVFHGEDGRILYYTESFGTLTSLKREININLK